MHVYKERINRLDTKYYTVTRIDGEYAYLKELDGDDGEVYISLFLLPVGIDIGTRLKCECLQYTIVE